MQVLVLSGTGPTFDLDSFAGTLFQPGQTGKRHFPFSRAEVALDRLVVHDEVGRVVPLLRRQAPEEIPHLTSATLDSMLREHHADFEMFDLAHVWQNDAEPACQPDAIWLSTSFIINKRQLAGVLRWITSRYTAPIVLGGQYSNIKYPEILRSHPEVTAVIRGDGEIATGPLLDALRGQGEWPDVPNVAMLVAGKLRVAPLTYGDMTQMASPTYEGNYAIVPYESMRGCPYSCKFCSFPAASPKFRWKPAEMIAEDWDRYARENGTTNIRALDSIFTVPPRRLRQLMQILAEDNGPTWEGFSRAGSVKDDDYIQLLTNGRCSQLSIGFESMSDDVLGYMDKRVTAAQNRRANQLLRGSAIGCRGHFMVGYPGETPQDFALTADFLRKEYAGEFKLSMFSFTDETMPVWKDADRFAIEIDKNNPEYGWRHSGMDVHTAQGLHEDTIKSVRWESDHATWLFWQRDYQTPLVPGNNRWDDLYIQKLVERLAFLPVDMTDQRQQKRHLDTILWQLRANGIALNSVRTLKPKSRSALSMV